MSDKDRTWEKKQEDMKKDKKDMDEISKILRKKDKENQ